LGLQGRRIGIGGKICLKLLNGRLEGTQLFVRHRAIELFETPIEILAQLDSRQRVDHGA
jgi:hypothetical protein